LIVERIKEHALFIRLEGTDVLFVLHHEFTNGDEPHFLQQRFKP